MNKNKQLLFLKILLGIIIIPVIFTQCASSKELRDLSGVKLRDTKHKEVFFKNKQQNIDLAGLLFLPEQKGLYPAVVIIHGSGTSQRDNAWYLTLTQHLQNKGILVLLPDKRGAEKSKGNWRTASFEDLATDTHAAIDFLKEQNLPISTIGLIGMSQGGEIAPIVASQNTDVKFVINIVGASESMKKQFQYEENHNLRQMGFLPVISDGIAVFSTFYHRNFGPNKAFWKAIGNFKPLAYWKQVKVPSFVLYGEDDTNVNSKRSARALEKLNKSNITIKIYAGSGHAIEDPLGAGNSIFRKDALEDITTFIKTFNKTTIVKIDKTIIPYSIPYELQSPIQFAHGDVTTNNGISFSNSGATLYTSKPTEWTFSNGKPRMGIYKNVYRDNHWIELGIIDFGIEIDAYHPVLSNDNKTMYFNSRSHPDSNNVEIPHKIWYSKLEGNKWGRPEIAPEINSEYYDSYPSIAKSGNIYFNSDRPGGKGGMDIYVSKFKNGKYQTPINLDAINSENIENDLVVDPSEKFIIFNRYIAPTKEMDLYISFNKNDEWTLPKVLEPVSKVGKWELTPSLSPDKRYFFYELDGKIMQIDLKALIEI